MFKTDNLDILFKKTKTVFCVNYVSIVNVAPGVSYTNFIVIDHQ